MQSEAKSKQSPRLQKKNALRIQDIARANGWTDGSRGVHSPPLPPPTPQEQPRSAWTIISCNTKLKFGRERDGSDPILPRSRLQSIKQFQIIRPIIRNTILGCDPPVRTLSRRLPGHAFSRAVVNNLTLLKMEGSQQKKIRGIILIIPSPFFFFFWCVYIFVDCDCLDIKEMDVHAQYWPLNCSCSQGLASIVLWYWLRTFSTV